MSDAALNLAAQMSAVLVKWDASVGDTPPEGDPMAHPACLEIVRLEPGRDPQLIFKRKQTE